jgi:hypothetical protein
VGKSEKRRKLMSRKAVEALCFLCKIAAKYEEFDFAKRRHYWCTAVNCGEYVVTDTAMRKLEAPHAADFKRGVSSLIAGRDNATTLIEIWVDPMDHVLKTHVVPHLAGQ